MTTKNEQEPRRWLAVVKYDDGTWMVRWANRGADGKVVFDISQSADEAQTFATRAEAERVRDMLMGRPVSEIPGRAQTRILVDRQVLVDLLAAVSGMEPSGPWDACPDCGTAYPSMDKPRLPWAWHKETCRFRLGHAELTKILEVKP